MNSLLTAGLNLMFMGLHLIALVATCGVGLIITLPIHAMILAVVGPRNSP